MAISHAKSGEVIEMREMADLHLSNAISMVERQIPELKEKWEATWMGAAGCSGDMASYYATGECDDADQALAQARLALGALCQERDRRAKGE